MSRYQKGDHVKFEVHHDQSRESEWLWLLVDESDDKERVVFGRVDSQPIVSTSLRLGQEIAVSYENVRDHRRFTSQET